MKYEILGHEGLLHSIGKEIQNVFQNLFKQRGKWRRKAAELDGYYSTDAPRAKNERKMVVYMVDGRTKHGGLADRLRGIISTYDVCKQLGYDFRIYFVHPFRLDDYLVPATFDWRVSEEELCYNPLDSSVVYCGSNGTHVELPFQRLYLKQRMQKATKQVHVYTNAHLLQRGGKFSQRFNELFRPSPALQEALDTHLANLASLAPSHPRTHAPSNYVSMTLRFQQLLGDFKENNYVTLSADEQQKLIDRCIDKIDELHRGMPEKKVLVTADSNRFLEEASKRLSYIYVVHGKVAHMDWSENMPFEVNLKSFLDLMMISRAERAYLLQTGLMYNSGFPRRAAQIGNIPFCHVKF